MVISTWLERLNIFRRPQPGAPVSLNRQLFTLAWPSLVENVLQTMLGVVDLIFVGQLGAVAIGGVGLGNQLMFALVVAFMGLSIGNMALVARAIGARDLADAESVAKQSLLLCVALSAIIAVIGYVYGEPVMRLMGAEPAVITLGTQFLQITTTFSIFIGIMFVGGGTLRGAGDTRTPMLITLFINGINIVLDYLLIFGNFGFPQLGAIGSAYATTAARGVGALLILYVLFKRNRVIPMHWRKGWSPLPAAIRRILNIGLPAAGENLIFQVGLLIFTGLVVGLGTNDLAALAVAFNAMSFSILPGFAFGVAAATLVGQNLGAKDIVRAEASAIQGLKAGIVWMSVTGVAFVVWRREIATLYTRDADVIRIAEMLIAMIGFMQPIQSVALVLSSALRGAGDTRVTLVITTATTFILRVGVAYLLGIVLGLGLFGVWLGWCSDFVVRASLVALRFRHGGWKMLKV